MKKSILLGSVAFLLYGTTTFGQGGNPGNGSTGTNYLGFDGTGVAQPLQIRNNFNQPLDIYTDNAFRLRVNPIGTTTINFSPVNTTGFVGINTQRPWSYLHIMGPNNTTWAGNGYREWMRTGTYYGENSDNLYTGLKPMGFNRSDAVWLWGDDSQGEPTNFSR